VYCSAGINDQNLFSVFINIIIIELFFGRPLDRIAIKIKSSIMAWAEQLIGIKAKHAGVMGAGVAHYVQSFAVARDEKA